MEMRHFIDTIESQPDIIVFPSMYDEETKIHSAVFVGTSNKLIIIDTTEDEIDDEDCAFYLKQLGLDRLLFSMFPQFKPASH